MKKRDENLDSLVQDIIDFTEENKMTDLVKRLRFKPIKTSLQKSTKISSTGKNLIVHVSSVDYMDGGIKSNSKVLFNEVLTVGDKKYELVSFIEHLGSSGFGHYFCYRKFYNNLWIVANDRNISYVEKEKVFQVANPYMLFYREL